MQRPGALLSRAQLEDRLYGWGEEIESNAVSVYIHQLRLWADRVTSQGFDLSDRIVSGILELSSSEWFK